MVFIISKRNFLVKRADGTDYLIKKDYVGEIPQDVFESGLVQGAIKGGLIATPVGAKDAHLETADAVAAKKEAAADIRPDAEKAETAEEQEDPEKPVKKTTKK